MCSWCGHLLSVFELCLFVLKYFVLTILCRNIHCFYWRTHLYIDLFLMDCDCNIFAS